MFTYLITEELQGFEEEEVILSYAEFVNVIAGEEHNNVQDTLSK